MTRRTSGFRYGKALRGTSRANAIHPFSRFFVPERAFYSERAGRKSLLVSLITKNRHKGSNHWDEKEMASL